MDVSQFLNNVENDDTLQNIRKEYLNSKRTLQELMSNQSPTKRMEFSTRPTAAPDLRKENNSDANKKYNNNIFHNSPKANQFQRPSGNINEDEFLRIQLREAMAKSKEPKQNIPSGNIDKLSSLTRLDDLEKRLYQHELQIQTLKSELYQSNSLNRSLQNKVNLLEEHMKMISASSYLGKTVSTANDAQVPVNVKLSGIPNSIYNGNYLDRPQSAPSTSSTSDWMRNALTDVDDTKVLLGLKKPLDRPENDSISHFSNTHDGNNEMPLFQNQRRNLSNFDDSTSRLINITGNRGS
ncbi:spindle pole component [Kluyveromyces marxianus]|nr:spindle pole component [Kluyveromyces marxianus]KAG0681461.1 spindle pole component [Kluyveromyces marxianus]